MSHVINNDWLQKNSHVGPTAKQIYDKFVGVAPSLVIKQQLQTYKFEDLD